MPKAVNFPFIEAFLSSVSQQLLFSPLPCSGIKVLLTNWLISNLGAYSTVSGRKAFSRDSGSREM
jgi:hypothetical protein